MNRTALHDRLHFSIWISLADIKSKINCLAKRCSSQRCRHRRWTERFHFIFGMKRKTESQCDEIFDSLRFSTMSMSTHILARRAISSFGNIHYQSQPTFNSIDDSIRFDDDLSLRLSVQRNVSLHLRTLQSATNAFAWKWMLYQRIASH